MSSEYDGALEVCAILERVREELEWQTTGPGRRERIATALLAAMLPEVITSLSLYNRLPPNGTKEAENLAITASVEMADCLIAELAKKGAT
jgi:hypothetical protein